MTKLQLETIAEVYAMLQKGLSNPIKINQVYQYINPQTGIEVPMRAKIMAVNRFMQLSYADVQKELQKDVHTQNSELGVIEAIGTIENKPQQTHKEYVDSQDIHNIQGFLSKKDKEELQADTAGTTLEIIDNNGKKRRTRTKKT